MKIKSLSRRDKKNIVITIGDPSGIGPEVALKALASPKLKGLANFLLVGDRCLMERVARDLSVKIEVATLDMENVRPSGFAYGVSRPEFGKAAVDYLDKAIDLIKLGEADAMVTAPINKASVISAGFRGFEGHTEYLAGKTNSKNAVMMFVGPKLKETLVTRHIAFKDVAKTITTEKIFSTIQATYNGLRDLLNIKKPVVAVAGLNPHAGECGLFGDEESRIIAPAVKKAGRLFKNIYGPVPPDVVFYDALNGKYDAVVALYHDQGLIPFKMLYFKDGVNMTLGLPFIRTSPDHGTAFDIAGKGMADPSSMIEAVKLASRLA
ncbi:MAG: 4-hydroxythreonine-4-phosphate dehydrogenase PdxA [Candidatus Omnitrophica bacterium]|nr:4-hydroxythreonine-4-phosphate dehydrogenase PdxA [Candidatus Omnitrophota bacterium]